MDDTIDPATEQVGLRRVSVGELLAIASRHQIEATVIALAMLRPDVAQAASRRALRSHLSSDCLALLDAIVADSSRAWQSLPNMATSEAQYDLAQAALDLTIDEVRLWSIGSLIALARSPLPESHDAREVAA